MGYNDTTLGRRLYETAQKPDLLGAWVTTVADKAQTQLASGTPLNGFTLHDAGHGRRVAERMCEVMPAVTLDGLSRYEVALLLLAAYCHDVGMVPRQKWLHELDAHLVLVTSDHGYLWQGGQAVWPVDGDDASVLAKHFKQGRCTNESNIELRTRTDKARLSGAEAAARGRFAWGGKVAGAIKLYRHGGVSFMECMTPWVVGA